MAKITIIPGAESMIVSWSGAYVRAGRVESMLDPVEIVLGILFPPAESVFFEIAGSWRGGVRICV